MKLMKHIMIALVLSAIPVAVFGQFGVADAAEIGVKCPDEECHVAPVFVGEGGFVGEAADDFDVVNFVVTCGSTSTSASAEPDSAGIVRVAFSMDNGLACFDDDGGSIEIHGIMDGGWYWVNDSMNSAVSALLAKDTLGNDATEPTDPGGVMLTAAKYGTFVKHEASGRVGIIPHILPEPMMEMEDADLCGPYWHDDDETFYNDTTNCMLGSGATKIVMTGPGRNGRDTRLGGSVERNVASAGDVTVSFALWSTGSGHVIGTSGSSTLVGHDITLPASLRPRFSVDPFTADFGVEIISPASTSMAEAGIMEIDGDVLSTMTEMEVVPGTPEATGVTDGLQNNNLAADPADATMAFPEITNGWGMFDGEVTYCRQAKSRNDDGDVELHFATSAGDVVMLEADPDGDGSLSALAADADWTAQLTWARAWNGATTDNSKFISILTMDLNDPATPEDATDDTSVPEVVCATTEGDEVETKGTGGVEIAATSPLCNDRTNQTVRLRITAPLSAARAQNDSTPVIAWAGRVGGTHVAAHTTLDVVCPAASSLPGRDLIPDNPFPVD